jgi:hypothetical protein
VILLSRFNFCWDNKINGCLEKPLIIPRLLQPAGKCQEAKPLLKIGWLNCKYNSGIEA